MRHASPMSASKHECQPPGWNMSASRNNCQPHVSLQIETCQPQKMIVSPQVETCQPQRIIVSLMSASTDVSDWNGQPHRMIVSLSAGSDWSSHPQEKFQPPAGTDWMCPLQKMSATSGPQIGSCQPQTGIVSLKKNVSLQLVQIEMYQPQFKSMLASSWFRLKQSAS